MQIFAAVFCIRIEASAWGEKLPQLVYWSKAIFTLKIDAGMTGRVFSEFQLIDWILMGFNFELLQTLFSLSRLGYLRMKKILPQRPELIITTLSALCCATFNVGTSTCHLRFLNHQFKWCFPSFDYLVVSWLFVQLNLLQAIVTVSTATIKEILSKFFEPA